MILTWQVGIVWAYVAITPFMVMVGLSHIYIASNLPFFLFLLLSFRHLCVEAPLFALLFEE